MADNIIQILLADDDPDDRLFFSEAFESTSLRYKLKMLNDGQELMDYLHSPDTTLPSIVFLDLNMPRKNGIDCLKEIRADEKLKNLSVAIYSTSSSTEDIDNAFILGANIYIKKPNNFNELKRVLQKVVTVNWQFHTANLNKETFMLTV
ncbi:response regulator [Flavobacterium foetidum]|uniref:response regulator n=1 Tax=Flavobacterium foetidum TaxID=2026681 RepID=UPI001074C65A|nr:response regulator [Flavobacterium foetidum]KAF2517176.1 response regulator [Flavobacterium foetidum]